MLKKAEGNMYPWVTHTHTHLAGECPHKCSYCYVGTSPRLKNCERYKGPIRLIEKEFSVNYGSGKTIFIEHCNDFLAASIPTNYKMRVLAHCMLYPDNIYVVQTKNLAAYGERFFLAALCCLPNVMLGTTIETNRHYSEIMRNAPPPEERIFPEGLTIDQLKFVQRNMVTFITIEPIMDFDMDIFPATIINQHPDFVNIGADSKGNNLPEPSGEKIIRLVQYLTSRGIEVRFKSNLSRLLPFEHPFALGENWRKQ